jgi:hypothetical protein
MSSHVGTIVVGGFLHKKEVITKELGGQPASGATDPNILPEEICIECLVSNVTL